MSSESRDRRRDAIDIWKAGVEAVHSDQLVKRVVQLDGSTLRLGSTAFGLDDIDRIVVIGGGKAGAGMTAGLEEALRGVQRPITGWINVPDGCVRPTSYVHLHGARPDGVNEPTARGVEGSARILEMAKACSSRDLCICLLSGGASALLPLPAEGITLEDKLTVTRHLSASGANIEQLNTVRKQLSQIKGGGLARTCQADQLVCLIISDVLGDPLDIIGSGPTVADSSTPGQAIEILDQFGARSVVHRRVFELLASKGSEHPPRPSCPVTNLIIGNNSTAVEAAGRHAEQLGYRTRCESVAASEGNAEDVGRELAELAMQMRSGKREYDCLISGGEPVVELIDASLRGRGGRNQQLVLAALQRLGDQTAGITLLSGGTDGEDGPTDAAGAWLDDQVAQEARQLGLDVDGFLRRNDAYHFFEPLEALLKTGPTDTNVCDLRVVVVDASTPSV